MSCEKISVCVSLSEEDIKFYSELISRDVAQMAEEIIAAFEQIGERPFPKHSVPASKVSPKRVRKSKKP